MPLQRDRSKQVVFVDRDGVINRNRDGDYVKSVDEFETLPGSLEALKLLNEAGRTVIVVSNQAGVGRGLMMEESLLKIDRHMRRAVSESGGEIAAAYYCRHRPEDECDCRKPAPGLLLEACSDFGIDASEAIFVGDAASDVQAGQAAGCKTILVLSGRVTADEAQRIDPPPNFVAAGLAEAVEWILAEENRS